MAGYLEVSCKCSPELEEIVCSHITEYLAGGLVTEDDGDDLIVRFYLPREERSREKVKNFGKFLVEKGGVDVDRLEETISVKQVDNIDWIKVYQKSFEPVVVGDVVIKSIWDDSQHPDKLEILLEPKMAFGTGKHETTRLCLAQVSEDVKPGDKLLDLGVGSGILAILAAKLGASECLGLDIDVAAIDNAKENIIRNKVEDRVTIKFGSMEKVSVLAYYDLVVSNLILGGITNLFESFMRALKPGGILILSGILREQEKEFCDFLKLKGISKWNLTYLNEWLCCRVTKEQ